MLGLFPMKAFSQCSVSGDIPFTVSNNTDDDFCIQCSGPSFRASTLFQVSAEEKNCTFYAANKGIFSPFGKWTCKTFVLNPDLPLPCDVDAQIDSIDFCVQDAPPDANNSVLISFDTDGTSINQAVPPCSTSASSFLGDNSKQEKSTPDTDIFLFHGTEGDGVKLRLDADPQAGHNGGNASLGISGNSLSDAISGTLPLEITTILPADGEYSIIVKQSKISVDQSFRGSYRLGLESANGIVELIKPDVSVEN
jgi:hypothetical protein